MVDSNRGEGPKDGSQVHELVELLRNLYQEEGYLPNYGELTYEGFSPEMNVFAEEQYKKLMESGGSLRRAVNSVIDEALASNIESTINIGEIAERADISPEWATREVVPSLLAAGVVLKITPLQGTEKNLMPWKPMATYYNRAFNVRPYPEPSAEESLSILALARDTASEEGFLIHGQNFANLKLPLIDALQHAPPRPAGYELEANTSGNPSVEQIVRVPLIEGEELEDVDVRTPRWDAFEKELRRNGKSLCVGLLEGINGSDTVSIKQVKERMVKVTRRMPPADCECGVPCFHVEIEPDPR